MRKLEGLDLARDKIRKRDNHTCQICGEIWEKGQRRFDVHHLFGEDDRTYSQSKSRKEWITLCHKCHLRLHWGKIELPLRLKLRSSLRFLLKTHRRTHRRKNLGSKNNIRKTRSEYVPSKLVIEQRKKKDEKKKQMIKMRIEERMTLEQIGQRFGVTRERVRQIIGKIPIPKLEFSFVCGTCNKVNTYKAHSKQCKRYCNKDCSKNRPLKYGVSPQKNPKEWGRRQNKARYADPVKYAKHKISQRKLYDKIMADPEKKKARAKYHKEMQRRLSQNPEWVKKSREQNRKAFKKRMKDPIKKAKWKESQRKYQKKRYQQKNKTK